MGDCELAIVRVGCGRVAYVMSDYGTRHCPSEVRARHAVERSC